jgi:tetratricopeptide (TPR) repeat protein
LRLLPTVSAIAWGRGGYSLGLFDTETAPNPYLRAGLDLAWYLTPSFRLSVGGSYDHVFALSEALYQGVSATLSAGVNFSAMDQRSKVEIIDIRILPVFPVFYKYYNDNSVGSIRIKNGENGPIRDVKVTFYVKQYMDAPKECAAIAEMKSGEVRDIPLFALFTHSILAVLEPTKAQAQIAVTYRYVESQRSTLRESVAVVNHRNASTWDDDRKVASFATVNDPAVMRLSKQAAGITRGVGWQSFDVSFRQAAGIFEEIGLYGLRYVPDANLPYSTASANGQVVDYIQFPIQTLQFKSGDCDDLSTLYAALLEAAGVESAFITVPGHIYSAFSLSMDPDQARSFFLRPEDLIMKDGRAWVPVEITLIQEGFLRAWQIGAREWRDADSAGTARFYPTREAWKLYEPVAMFGTEAAVDIPSVDALIARYTKTMTAFVQQEVDPKAEKINDEIARARKDPKPLNKLGVLFARYGLFDKAEQSFRDSLKLGESTPAWANLANILFLKNDFKGALAAYKNAARLAPKDARVLLGLSRSSYELEDRDSSARWAEELARIDPAMAEKYAFLKSGGSSGSRAAEVGQEEMPWVE